MTRFRPRILSDEARSEQNGGSTCSASRGYTDRKVRSATAPGSTVFDTAPCPPPCPSVEGG